MAVREILRATRDRHQDTVLEAVVRLERDGVINRHEAQQLNVIVEAVHSDHEPARVFRTVCDVHDALLLSPDASPAAVAIASIALDATSHTQRDREAYSRVGEADVGGALAGAALGGTIGSAFGTSGARVGSVIGGVIGGAIASAAASKRE
jgi:hypothetical protein